MGVREARILKVVMRMRWSGICKTFHTVHGREQPPNKHYLLWLHPFRQSSMFSILKKSKLVLWLFHPIVPVPWNVIPGGRFTGPHSGEPPSGVLTTKKTSPQSSKCLGVLDNDPERLHSPLSPWPMTTPTGASERIRLLAKSGKSRPFQNFATSLLPGNTASPVTLTEQGCLRKWFDMSSRQVVTA